MHLREYDWDAQLMVEVEYPDELIADFVNWLRQTKQWKESVSLPETVYNRYLLFERKLTDARNEAATEKAEAEAVEAKGKDKDQLEPYGKPVMETIMEEEAALAAEIDGLGEPQELAPNSTGDVLNKEGAGGAPPWPASAGAVHSLSDDDRKAAGLDPSPLG